MVVNYNFSESINLWQKKRKIIKIIVLILLCGVIIWWLMQPAGNRFIQESSPCEPDYMGGCF